MFAQTWPDMDASALQLVVGGAFLHATWNFLAKKIAGGTPFIWLCGTVSLVLTAPFVAYGWRDSPPTLALAAWGAIAASAIVHVAYSIVLQKGYQQSDFSIVYPVARGIGPMISVVGAVLVLGEMPTPLGWIGIGSIMLGIVLIAGIHDFWRTSEQRCRQGVLWGVLTGLTIAAYTVIDGWAIKVLGVSPLVYYGLGLALRTLLMTPAAFIAPELVRQQWRHNRIAIVAIGILSPLAYQMVLFAMLRAPLSVVAPVRELSMLLGTLLGAVLLREKAVVARMAGAAFMVLGVVMLAQT